MLMRQKANRKEKVMAKKYVDNDGLLYFWQKIKNTFAKTSDVPTKTSDLTNDSGYITSADVPEGAAASTTTPKMDGTAAVGTEKAFARGDHVHPVDTSRAPTSHASTGTTYGKGTSSNYGHVKLSDSTTATTAAASGGTAATPKAVSDALAAAKSYADGLDTGISDVTVDGTSVVTGGIAAVDLSGKVPTSRTVNGKALSANITLTGADIDYANGEVTIDTAISTLDNSKVDKVDGKGLSTNDYTSAEKTKLSGIAAGAEVNVQADWSQTTTTADDYIKNKPTIPSAGTGTSYPVMDGTKSLGTQAGFARVDHVHPTDTSRAPLASPGFTGKPTAPTAFASTNTDQIATTAFVHSAIDAAKVGAAMFHGTVNAASDISDLTAYKSGWYWVVGTAGTYVGETCEAGDMIFCIKNRVSSYAAADFSVVQNNLDLAAITNAEIDTIVAS